MCYTGSLFLSIFGQFFCNFTWFLVDAGWKMLSLTKRLNIVLPTLVLSVDYGDWAIGVEEFGCNSVDHLCPAVLCLAGCCGLSPPRRAGEESPALTYCYTKKKVRKIAYGCF